MGHRIVVVGSSNTDMILSMEHLPGPGETVLGGEFSTAPGGKGANQAVAAARAGGDVSLVARVGTDMFGDRALEGFRREGIDTACVARDDRAPSGVALIFVDRNGENSIAVASGANMSLSPDDVDRARSLFNGASVLLMQLETPVGTVEHAARHAVAEGVSVILNPAPASRLPDSLLRLVSILTPNATEAGMLAGIPVNDEASAASAASILRKRGPETVLVTLGARGAVVDSDGFRGIVLAFSAGKAVDTTAAGDVFNGALAVACAEGRDLRDAVRFACAAAALSVTRPGAQTSVPMRTKIDALLNRAGGLTDMT